MKVLLVDAELLVLLDGHLVLDVDVGRGELGLLVVEHGVDEVLLGLGQVTDVVALLLEALEHAVDGAKHVEVRGGADVALVGGKEKTVMASFLSTFFFLRRLAHFMARAAICEARSWRECDLPVLESRPEKMMGSRPPSSSGSATWSATCTG